MREHLRDLERWIALVRLLAVPFAALQVAITADAPAHYRLAASLLTGTLAVGAIALWVLSRNVSDARLRRIGFLALVFDSAIVWGFVLVYHFEAGTPTRQLLFLPVVEAAVRYGMRGALVIALLETPVAAAFEWLRSDNFGTSYKVNFVTFQLGVLALFGLIVGWLVTRFHASTDFAQARAAEAEQLRDRLGRRVDVLEAANRCARALGSSLELESAFGAFIREVAGVVPFDRMAVVLAEGHELEVLASSGEEAPFRRGGRRAIAGSIAEPTLRGQTTYRADMRRETHPDEVLLVESGLRSRLAAPLLAGTTTVGLISFMRKDVDAFTREEIELVSLLGRLAGTAVQNIRAFEAERRTVEELRRLSALRADFVSLVSHELRSPMAAVIGSARTLQARWRELQPDQRESFLALIADETSRLATLIGDVLDTSRIEAGTFSYTFEDVDVGALVEESVATAAVGQDEVRLLADVSANLPPVRADPARLRQVLGNLIENAVKYSDAGSDVDVRASADTGVVRVEVRDRGPGIASDQHVLIFEKFGRAKGHGAKPGSGLGLFIARSIAEAHGGTLDVRSAPGQGATFTLELPAA